MENTNTENTNTVKADAKQRSLRTLAQGLAVDVLVAVGAGALIVLDSTETFDIYTPGAWLVLATAVGKSALTAVASYFARLKLPPG